MISFLVEDSIEKIQYPISGLVQTPDSNVTPNNHLQSWNHFQHSQFSYQSDLNEVVSITIPRKRADVNSFCDFENDTLSNDVYIEYDFEPGNLIFIEKPLTEIIFQEGSINTFEDAMFIENHNIDEATIDFLNLNTQ